jgi:hypothetical protein
MNLEEKCNNILVNEIRKIPPLLQEKVVNATFFSIQESLEKKLFENIDTLLPEIVNGVISEYIYGTQRIDYLILYPNINPVLVYRIILTAESLLPLLEEQLIFPYNFDDTDF